MKNRKYRAWADGKMHYPTDEMWLYFSSTGYWSLCIGDRPGEIICDSLESEDAVLMQFTGSQDKCLRDIYDSDIIESVCETINIFTNKPTGCFKIERYEVRWEEDKARWGRFKDGKFELLSGLTKEYLLKWYTVIGNKLKNPELAS